MNTTADFNASRRQPNRGFTRDSQNKRLTTTVWVDTTDQIPFVMLTLEPLRSQNNELNEYDKALDKLLWFSIFHNGSCYVPLPHWKLMVAKTFKAMGGKRAVKRTAPSLHDDLARQDRPISHGRMFRDVVQQRFDRGMDGE